LKNDNTSALTDTQRW